MVSISRYTQNPTSYVGLQRLNRMLDEAFTGWPFSEQGSAVTSAWFAPTDVSEDANSLQITLEAPGVRPEDVKISVENNILTIRGEKRQESEEENERVHRFERSYGVFERSFVLPNTVDPEKISASFENGVLTIRVPKVERARPREIPVKASQAVSTGQVGSGPSVQSKSAKEEGSTAKAHR
jgi:HSP20 family protein